MNRWRIVALRGYQVFSNLAFDPIRLFWRIVEAPLFVRNLAQYRFHESERTNDFHIKWRYLYPVLGDRHSSAGQASGHYFHQDIWAARHIYESRPTRHVDVGSSVGGFVAHLLSFREVEYVDIRPLRSNVTGLHFTRGDMVGGLPYPSGSIDSISALHVVEHIGLGRYGDPVDPSGWLKSITELKRVAAPGGRVYFSTPIGTQRLEFDGHRVFDPQTILRAFAPFRLLEFSYVDDRGDHVHDGDLSHFRGWYCAGLFMFEGVE